MLVKKLSLLVLGAVFSSGLLAQSICSVTAAVDKVIPSDGDTGLFLQSPVSVNGCSCDHNILWIDINSDGGKSMYTGALSAHMAGRTVFATYQDGHGEGAAGNQSVAARYWGSCRLLALEIR